MLMDIKIGRAMFCLSGSQLVAFIWSQTSSKKAGGGKYTASIGWVPSIDVYLWYNHRSALLKLDIISEHPPSSIMKSDLPEGRGKFTACPDGSR